MFKYKIKKRWRHFKYRLLKLFFKEEDLSRMIDINRLDFTETFNIKSIKAQRWLTQEEREFFRENKDVKYGLQYELARQMAEVLASHIMISEVYDTDEEKYICVGEINLIERKY